MSTLTARTVDMVKMLPDDELHTIHDLLKMLLRAWDPDFTKVTNEEAAELDAAEKAMEDGDYYDEKDVWG